MARVLFVIALLMFSVQARAEDKKIGTPLTHQELLATPIAEWNGMVKTHRPPTDINNFETYMRYGSDRLVDIIVFKTANEIFYMRRENQHKKDYKPVVPEEAEHDMLIREFFDNAITAAKANPEFDKPDVVAMGEDLKALYSAEIDRLIEKYQPLMSRTFNQ